MDNSSSISTTVTLSGNVSDVGEAFAAILLSIAPTEERSELVKAAIEGITSKMTLQTAIDDFLWKARQRAFIDIRCVGAEIWEWEISTANRNDSIISDCFKTEMVCKIDAVRALLEEFGFDTSANRC